MNRRNFLKMAFTALLAALTVPRKAEAEPVDCGRIVAEPELYDQCRAVLDQCECNFDVRVHPKLCEPVEKPQVFYTRDKGETWEYLGEAEEIL